MSVGLHDKKNICSISLIKGISIIFIFLVHFSQIVLANKNYLSFLELGCQSFFTISLFLFVKSMDDNNNFFKTFKKRIIRLYPSYILIILLYFVIGTISVTNFERNIFDTTLNAGPILANVFLIHGLIPGEANNLVVRGGWFIGTLIILFLLCGVIKVMSKHSLQKRIYTYFLFLVVSTTVIILLYFFANDFFVAYNDFLYFSFLNQIPCLIIGNIMYHKWKNSSILKIKLPLTKSIVFLSLSIVLYFFNVRFIALTLSFSIFTFYLFSFLFRIENTKGIKGAVCSFLSRCGNLSLEIYLTHIFVAHEITSVLISLLEKMHINFVVVNYVILFPLLFVFSIFLAKIFRKMVLIFTSYLLGIYK